MFDRSTRGPSTWMQQVRVLEEFCGTDIGAILARGEGPDDESQRGEPEPAHLQDKVLRLFRAAAELVPAYRALLAEEGLLPTEIVSIEDFRRVPLVDKLNYLHKYPLPQRCIGGAITEGDVDFIHVSSGSSGEPTFWARNASSEIAIAARFEQILVDNFGASHKTLLAVNVFPLGSWVGGIFTTFCLRYCSIKGLKLTMVTPGNVPPEILRCIRHLGERPRRCSRALVAHAHGSMPATPVTRVFQELIHDHFASHAPLPPPTHTHFAVTQGPCSSARVSLGIRRS